MGLLPGEIIRIIEKTDIETSVELRDRMIKINTEDLLCFWGMDISNGT
jgi:hypothetical protein